MTEDKRETERVPILGELRGEIMVLEPMAIKEIARGGVQVETRFPLQLNSLHDLRLTLDDRSIVVKGRVAHCQISDVDQDVIAYRSGLEFIEPSDRIEGAIVEFLASVKISRRPD